MTSSNGKKFRVTGPCAGIHRLPVNSPHRGQWRGALMFSLIRIWRNDWVDNRDAGDYKRHRGYYNVPVIWHDDVIKWKYFHVIGHLCGALIISLICAWINSWVGNRMAVDLKRHRVHYGVTEMKRCTYKRINHTGTGLDHRWLEKWFAATWSRAIVWVSDDWSSLDFLA